MRAAFGVGSGDGESESEGVLDGLVRERFKLEDAVMCEYMIQKLSYLNLCKSSMIEG